MKKNITCKIFAIMILFILIINNVFTIALAINIEGNDTIKNEITNEEVFKNKNTVNSEAEETSNNSFDNNTNNTNNSNNTQNNITNVVDNNINNNLENQNNVNNNVTNNSVDTNSQNNVSNDINNIINQNNINDNDVTNSDNGITTMSLERNTVGVQYRTHVQNVGWQNYVQNGQKAGTEGKSLRLEGININITGLPSGVKVKYQTHIENIGWQDWKENGQMAGTEGKKLRLEGIKIKLEFSEEYSIMYRTHIENIGWQDWKTDGEMAGTEGRSLRLEAIEIKLVKKQKVGLIHIDSPKSPITLYSPTNITVSGWKMANVYDTKIKVCIDNDTPIDVNINYSQRSDVVKAISGYGSADENLKPGFSFTINTAGISNGNHTIKVLLYSPNGVKIQGYAVYVNIDRGLHVSYRTHVQNIGWQDYLVDGAMSGTEGRGLRLEALNIKLYGAPSNAKIIYRTHVQSLGWQNWTENGNLSGTEGRSLRLEAIEIKLQNMDNYTVEYQVHIEDKGWSGWYIDGETAGTVGQSKRLEAIRIRLVPKYKRRYNGIDVSQFNGNINWGFVKRENYDFAMIRVGYRGYGQAGNFAMDSSFTKNIQAAQSVGQTVGIYFVTQAINEQEAIEEANWVIDKIKGYNIKYPVAIDVEYSTAPNNSGRADNLDRDTRTRVVKKFCETMQNSGYTPLVYTNVDWANNKLNMSSLSAYDTWIASYKYDANSNPGYNGKYSIWQYSNKGTVNGILGNVDLNVGYKKY